jgi:hypothetical protein
MGGRGLWGEMGEFGDGRTSGNPEFVGTFIRDTAKALPRPIAPHSVPGILFDHFAFTIA